MNEIKWLKNAVSICIADLPEDHKRIRFEELEKEYEKFTVREKDHIANIIKSDFNINDSIYVYSEFLYYMGNIKFAEAILDAILTGEFDTFTGTMLEVQTYKKYFKWLYKKRRKVRRKNIERFNRVLNVNYPYIKFHDRNKKRIVIVTEQLLGVLHAPSKVVLDIAYSLKKMGYEILLFVCPCDAVVPEELWYKALSACSEEVWKNMQLEIIYRNESFEGYQINMIQDHMKVFHMMLALIYAWNPAFVLDLGTINPVVDLAGRFTTHVAWKMSLECPVSEGEILIRVDRLEEELEKEYAEALNDHQKQLFMGEHFPVLIENPKGNYNRADLGLPENKFLIALVGNRLDAEINDPYVTVMAEILNKMPCVDFVIIGEVVDMKTKLMDGIFKDRVHFLGYRIDLVEVYSVLDLYLNPDRGGGGFSGAMALIAGIPVVTLPYCDVAYNVGEEFVVPDYDNIIKTVIRYAEDKDFYHQKEIQAQRYKDQNTDVKLIKFMEKLLNGIFDLIADQ